MPHKKHTTAIILVIIVLLVLAGAAYWYLLMGPVTAPQATTDQGTPQNGFQPLGRNGTGQNGGLNGVTATSSQTGQGSTTSRSVLPVLRLLSGAPVGGYGVSTSASGATTTVRWINRGRGNVYEATYDSSLISTLSNTVVPKVFASSWNNNLNAFIGSVLNDDDSSWMAVYTTLVRQTASTSQTDVAPYSLRGKKLPTDIIGYAISPKKDKLFMLVNENGSGIGYVSSFDGSATARIFSTPLTQVNVDWPNDNAITIATKGSANSSGFFYSVNPKTGVWSKLFGPIAGLSALMSHDGKYVAWSGTRSGGGIAMGIYSVSKNSNTDAGIRTLADKCVWGNLHPDTVYCAVPSNLASGTYPDDWYRGTVSNVDGIWQADAVSGVVHQISSLTDKADRIIDAFTLGLNAKDGYLFFMNKNDLSLWSLDLTRAQ